MGLRRTLAVVAGLYVVEGFPMGVFRDVWPVYLRDAGVPLRWIGFASGLYLAWSAKLLWSPLVDRFGERRAWIRGALLGMAAALVLVPALDPAAQPGALFAALAFFCLASATQDIAIDAYTIGIVERGAEGPANAVRITAYRVGLVLAGGAVLGLVDRVGWTGAHAVAALLAGAMALAVAAAPRVEVPAEARRDWRGAFRPWARRGGVGGVLAFVLLYRLGDLALAPMIRPFWVDRGLSHDEIALVTNTLGSLATVAGAAAGGWLVARLGIGRALWVVGALAVGSNLGYAGAAAFPELGRPAVYGASFVESFCSGLAAAGFLSYLMRICDREHAAVQYATLTGLYALPGTLAGAVSGVGAEVLGYAGLFAATALAAAPAFVFLPAARTWLGDVGSGSTEP